VAEAGYSARSLSEKLGIKSGMEIVILSAPEQFSKLLQPLPSGVHVRHQLLRSGQSYIHLFVREQEDLRRQFGTLREALAADGTLWISWPKGSSKLKTDLNENIIRDIGLSEGLVDVKVAAIDGDWSGLKFVYRLKDRK
jgi:hypothetical protein